MEPRPVKKQRHYKIVNEGRCRMCLRSDRVRRLTRHHLVPQRHFEQMVIAEKMSRRAMKRRRDANENVIPLCRVCHDLIDCGTFSDQRLWRAMLRRLLTPGEISAIRRRMGEEWFDRNYPPLAPSGTRERITSSTEEVNTWQRISAA